MVDERFKVVSAIIRLSKDSLKINITSLLIGVIAFLKSKFTGKLLGVSGRS
jgi:hypothetical protein